MHTVFAANHPESNGIAEQTISSIKLNLFKIRTNEQLSVVQGFGKAVAAIRMVPS